MLKKSIDALVRYRYWLLALAAAIGVAATIGGRGLTLDRSIENMFAQDDPILVPYRRLQRIFGQHEVVLAMYSDPKLTTPEGLERIGQLAEQFRAVPGVVAVVSLLDPPGAADFSDAGRGKLFREVFSGYTHNNELDAAGVICLINRPGAGDTPRRETLAQMQALIAKHPQGALVGEPVLIEEAFDLLEEDGRRLNTWCTVLVLLTILACFRSVRWLVLPPAVVQLTLAMTNASLVLAGLQLSMVSSMLGAIVTVVGVASVVHVMVHYQDLRREGLDRRAALSQTLDELAAPVTVAILTDGAGFASLMVSKVGPVHDFGLMMAVGSLLVLPACILLVPALAWLSDADRPGGAVPDDRLVLGTRLTRILACSNRHVRGLCIAAAALAALAIFGSQRLEHETDFTKNFRQDSSIVRAYSFVETRFGGAGVWDLLLPAPKVLDGETLKNALELEGDLKKSAPQLTKAISLADALAAGVGGPVRLAKTPAFGVRLALGAMRGRMPQFMDTLYRADPETGQQWIHVLLRAPEQLGAAEKSALIERVQTTAAAKFKGAETTGYYVLLTRLIESVLADQWKAFIVATLVVLTMMIIAIRDLRLTAVTMAPNMFPSLVLFGVMGLLGVKVNMGAAMIAAVSIGLSVDTSVHYTMFYQRLRRGGMSCEAALHRAQDSVGRAAVFSTLALTIGFATLVVSDFVPTIYFGVLVSLSMIGGLIGNVIVLPVLIRWVDGGREHGAETPNATVEL